MKKKVLTELEGKRKSFSELRGKFNTRMNHMKFQIHSAKSKIVETEHENKTMLSKCFSDKQIEVLKGNWGKARWTQDDISKAIVLRVKSTAAYDLVRESWGIPLPGISTLQNWISKIDFSPGLISPVLNLLKFQFANTNRFYRQAVLSFDELALDGLICYDEKHDKIVGPCSYMLVMFVRSLFGHWKQPIFYGYDYRLDKDTVIEVLDKIQETGIEVTSTVCDLGPNNKKFKNDFQISPENSHFSNPSNGSNVWVFYDLPHLIKRLRDNSLDYVITFADKNYYSVDDFYKILEMDNGEIRICYKITKKTLTVKGRDRMNVRVAMQLFSRTVATFFRKYFPNSTRIQKLAKFIELVNNFTDLMNGRHMDDVKFSGSVEQLEILDQMEYEIRGLRVGKSNHLLPFQQGFLISIRSARGLLAEMKGGPLRADYLLMSRVNQDIDENMFGTMRAMGRFNDHPNAIDAHHRLKVAMLWWNFKSSKRASVANVDSTEKPYLTSGLLAPLMELSRKESNVCRDAGDELVDTQDLTDVSDDSSWKNYRESLTFQEIVHTDAQEYVFGYIVSKLKDKYPEMVLSKEFEHRVPQSWTQTISNGNLSIPSYEWLSLFRKWEDHFMSYHERQDGDHWDLNRCEGVCGKLNRLLSQKYPSIPLDAIKVYVKTRTMLRIKSFNTQIKNTRYRRKNKLKQFVASSQVVPEASECERKTDWDILFDSVINPTELANTNMDEPEENEELMDIF